METIDIVVDKVVYIVLTKYDDDTIHLTFNKILIIDVNILVEKLTEFLPYVTHVFLPIRDYYNYLDDFLHNNDIDIKKYVAEPDYEDYTYCYDTKKNIEFLNYNSLDNFLSVSCEVLYDNYYDLLQTIIPQMIRCKNIVFRSDNYFCDDSQYGQIAYDKAYECDILLSCYKKISQMNIPKLNKLHMVCNDTNYVAAQYLIDKCKPNNINIMFTTQATNTSMCAMIEYLYHTYDGYFEVIALSYEQVIGFSEDNGMDANVSILIKLLEHNAEYLKKISLRRLCMSQDDCVNILNAIKTFPNKLEIDFESSFINDVDTILVSVLNIDKICKLTISTDKDVRSSTKLLIALINKNIYTKIQLLNIYFIPSDEDFKVLISVISESIHLKNILVNVCAPNDNNHHYYNCASCKPHGEKILLYCFSPTLIHKIFSVNYVLTKMTGYFCKCTKKLIKGYVNRNKNMSKGMHTKNANKILDLQ
jgi:hypothetical protein